MKNVNQITNIPILLIGCYLFLGLFILSVSDYFFWDAAILEVAILEKDFSGWRGIHTISGLEINYWYYVVIASLSEYLNLQPGLAFAILLMTWMVFLVNELGKFCCNYLDVERKNLNHLKAIIIILPIWSILASQVHHFYIFTYSLLFLGFNLFHRKSVIQKSIAIILIMLSFSNASNHVMIIALFFIPLLKQLVLKENFLQSQALVNFCSITILSLVFFLIYRDLFPASNVFDSYNKIEIISLASYFHGILVFGFWFVLSISALICSAIAGLIFAEGGRIEFKASSKTLFPILSMAILLIASAAPYILVNKHPGISDLYTWEARHAVLFFLMLAPMIIIINQAFCKSSKTTLAIFIAVTLAISSHHYFTKVYDKFYFFTLEQSLPALPPEPGFVFIETNLQFSNYLRYYDLGHVLYKKYGSIEWYSELADDVPSWANESNTIDTALQNNQFLESYSGRKLGFLVGEDLRCITTISIQSNTKDFLSVLRWSLLGDFVAAESKITSEKCS